MEPTTGNVWLLYATGERRQGEWLEAIREDNYVFWTHGNDAHTRNMRPGDTALICVSGEPAEIIGVAVIAAVRSPFLLDTQQAVQRIPALVVRDLRANRLSADMIAKALDRDQVRLVTQQGGVHPVAPDVAEAVSSMLGMPVPLPESEAYAAVFNSKLWDVVQRAGYRVMPDYVPAGQRKHIAARETKEVVSHDEFMSLLDRAWRGEAPPEAEQASFQAEPEQSTLDTSFSTSMAAPPESEAPEAPQTARPADALDELAGDAKAPDETTIYSVQGRRTAQGLPDTVTLESRDHMQVGKEARAFARLIASDATKPPLSIGIFGRWGSGKTFFMTRISKYVRAIADKKVDGFHSRIAEVEFNAWHYMETNVWASLVDVIFKRLDEERAKYMQASTQSLFDHLATAQNLRLDAIENLAQRIEDANKARHAVRHAREEYRKQGPSGTAIWQMVLEAVSHGNSVVTTKDITDVASEFGVRDFKFDIDALRSLSARIKSSQQDGTLAVQMLRKQAINPLFVWIFTLLICAFAVSQWPFSERTWHLNVSLQAATTTVLSLISVWGGFVVSFANRFTRLTQKVGTALANAEQDAVRTQQADLDKAELALEEANRNLEEAEHGADEAYKALAADSPGARLASFIQRRAESDDYSKHLGVIATIRRDFEQLSALMARDKADPNARQRMNDFRDTVSARLATLRETHASALSAEANAVDRERLEIAMAELQATLTEPQEHERPFTRIVLYIDDLDRCPPDKVADVLQAIHLFLNFPLFIIVVCVDERWMSRSLIAEYGELVNGSSGATPGDYLEKIFQIPYWTRPMDRTASDNFARSLIEGVPEMAAFEFSESASRRDPGEAPTPAPTPGPEPQRATQQGDDLPDAQADNALPDPTPDRTELEGAANDETATADAARDDDEADDHYLPISISSEERDFIGKASGFAGDTPRRTLRFINVYMLIKSSMEEDPDAPDFVDQTGETFGYQALLIQLALATRADHITALFFDEFEQYYAGLGEAPGKLSQFLENLERTFGDGFSNPDNHAFRELIAFIRAAEDIDNDRIDRQFFTDFVKTHTLARRYTFAAPTAP